MNTEKHTDNIVGTIIKIIYIFYFVQNRSIYNS